MEQGPTEKRIFKDHLKYGLPLPEAIKNAPFLHDGNDFYYTAFVHLCTCRVSNMQIGHISYFMCMEYCRVNNIEGSQREDFVEVILAVDDWYVKYQTAKNEKLSKSNKGKKKSEKEVDKDED